MTFRELVAECRRIASDTTMRSDDEVRAFVQREKDGVARQWIVDCWIHGPEIVASAAESSLAAGCSPRAVADALEEAERRMTEYEEQTAAPKPTRS